MNKPWLGYLSSALLLLAGILQFVAGKNWLGVLFVLLALTGLVLKLYIGKKSGPDKEGPAKP